MPRGLLAAAILGLLVVTVADVQAGPKEAAALRQALDRQPRWNEKPFAPAAGSVAHVHPPAFVWLPLSKRPASYVLAVSTAADFAPALRRGQTLWWYGDVAVSEPQLKRVADKK